MPRELKTQWGGKVTIQAAEAEQTGPPSLHIEAYNGGSMTVAKLGKVAVDLSDLRIPAVVSVQHDHKIDARSVVGHGAARVEGGRLILDGVASGADYAAKAIVEAGRNGYPWQASIGVRDFQVVKVEAGATATVNGQQVNGPAAIVKSGELYEISVLPFGADSSTRATITGGADQEGVSMTFDQWLQKMELKREDLDKQMVATLHASYDKATAEGADENLLAGLELAVESGVFAGPVDQTDEPETPQPSAGDAQAAIKAERERVAAIQRDCRRMEFPSLKAEFSKIETEAIAAGLTVEETRKRLMDTIADKLPAAPTQPTMEAADMDVDTLQARFMANLWSEDQLTEEFGDKTVEAAHKSGKIGLSELTVEAARLAGLPTPRRYGKIDEAWVADTLKQDDLRAAASGVSISGILGNTLNKMLVAAFRRWAGVATSICANAPVDDYKTHYSYRATSSMEFEEVGPDGDLTTGNLVEDEMTNQAKAYGKVLEITYRDIRNDDLGVFQTVPEQLGRGAAQKVEKTVFELLLGNSNVTRKTKGDDGEPTASTAAFFSSTFSNLLEGSSYALSTSDGIGALEMAEEYFLTQTDCWGEPIGVMPRFLLVPPQLKSVATRLMRSEMTMAVGSTAKNTIPTTNIYNGRFEVVVSPYLSLATLTGYSTTAWYLMADPGVLPALQLVWLDNVRAPRVTAYDNMPKKRSVGWSAWLDFGAAFMEPRAMVKVTGVDASS